MQLVGLLDSPFVRRVAISLLALRVPFEHRPVSVFRGIEDFRRINPVVKAPTLITADGTVLMDSNLILQWVEAQAAGRTLWPSEPAALAAALRATGLALAVCEKTAQVVYERGLRPPEKQHEPWVDRLSAQLRAACAELEADLQQHPADAGSVAALGHGGLSTAVAWHFTQAMLPGLAAPQAHPALVALSEAAEALPEFRAAPHGEGALPAAVTRG